MLWVAFAHNRRTSLIPLNGDPLAARDRVTSQVIQELYRAFLSDIMNDDDVFIYNSAGLYRGQIVKDILREMNIRVISQPPYSPDLNPIENLQALIKAELYRLYPELEHVPDTDETLDVLIRGAQEAQHNIDNRILFRLATTIEDRVKAVIKAERWYIKY